MKCTRPFFKRVQNPYWDGNPLTKELHVPMPCGKCLACRINRRREWTARLMQEEIYSSSSMFVTLTYDEDHVPWDDNCNFAVCKRDIQLWLKRLRKKYGDGIRYMVNSEYGPTTGRPHYHGIIFNLPMDQIFKDVKVIKRYEHGKLSIGYISPTFTKVWGNGDVEFSDATKERCGYCAKYFVDRKEVDEILVPNFSLSSRGGRSADNFGGIGSRYAKDIAAKVRYTGGISMFHPGTGNPVALPRLYKNYIFSEEERKVIFQDYLSRYFKDEQNLIAENIAYENRDIIEQNQMTAMSYKHKKSKI